MNLRHTITAIACLFLSLPLLPSTRTVDAPIVIITSYNPEERTMNSHLTSFSEAFSASEFTNPVIVENMNCLNLPESVKWKDRMWELLEKYYEDGSRPAAVIVLGIEASAAYLSLDTPEIKSTPVLIGSRGDNIVLLPEKGTKLSTWEPEKKSVSADFPDYNIVSAFLFDYDIEKNIEIVNHLDPHVDTLNFLTDNTFGGITLQAHLKDVMSNHPEYQCRYLDGRVEGFTDVFHKISDLPENNAVIIGTWRIDKSDSYAISNTTYALAHSNANVPAVTLTNVGMGIWALGGHVPTYQCSGTQLATTLCDYLRSGKVHGTELLPSVYKFDYLKAEEMGYDMEWAGDYVCLNKPESFFKEHFIAIIIMAVVFLLLILTVSLAFAMYFLKKRRLLNEKLENANKVKSDFIASISHEIRTPLNAVMGFSQMLTDPNIELSSEEKDQYGEYILDNSQALCSLVNDVLALATMDLESVTIETERLDAVSIAESAAKTASRDLDPAISIKVYSSEPKVFINADKSRVLLVLSNLLNNSKKFTEEGSITVDIKPSTVAGFVEMSVSDTGCGIPEEEMEYVFGRFTKLNSFKQGPGLGLAVVKTSVEGMGGKVWVDKFYKDGARFVILLPASEE